MLRPHVKEAAEETPPPPRRPLEVPRRTNLTRSGVGPLFSAAHPHWELPSTSTFTIRDDVSNYG